MNLIISCRATMDKAAPCKKMLAFMSKPKHKKIYRKCTYKVEPMQGLVKDIFELVPIHKWPICPISALRSKFDPRNIKYMPVVKFLASLDLDQIRLFLDEH